MKHNWRMFEIILSGIQICLGILIWFFVYLTCNQYYTFLWKNPLMDHHSIVQMAVRKKYNFSNSITYCYFISNTFNQKLISRLGDECYNLDYAYNNIDN